MSIIEHSGDRAGANASNGQIILPNQAMPALIHIIPQEHRPFFSRASHSADDVSRHLVTHVGSNSGA